uniref:Uncharacterized protein n=1 Tax=Pundamilia nyererei TaxID=303518 RepID=A0A3B4GNM9_9CICH
IKARRAELEAARLAKEKEEEEAKQAAQQAKKEKEIQKKAIKKERQKLRTMCKVSTYSVRRVCVLLLLGAFSLSDAVPLHRTGTTLQTTRLTV